MDRHTRARFLGGVQAIDMGKGVGSALVAVPTPYVRYSLHYRIRIQLGFGFGCCNIHSYAFLIGCISVAADLSRRTGVSELNLFVEPVGGMNGGTERKPMPDNQYNRYVM